MSVLFVSDLHLCCDSPELIARFRAFLAGPARRAEALYILGDLFDLWLGDDITPAAMEPVIAALAELKLYGTDLYIMPGNRDLLLGEGFAHTVGARMLRDPYTVVFDGESIVLTHGDTLCTQDPDYQRYRRVVHSPWFQRFALSLPAAWRRWLGLRMRKMSQKAIRHKDPAIMDVDQSAVEATLQHYGARRLIHGHTHQPKIHDFMLDGIACQRIVLTNWTADRDGALEFRADGARLVQVADLL